MGNPSTGSGPGEVILSKRNELVALQFAPTAFTFHGKRYASLEGFCAMMKYPEDADDPRAKFPLSNGSTHASKSPVFWVRCAPCRRPGQRDMKKMGITWITFEGKRMEYKPHAANTTN